MLPFADMDASATHESVSFTKVAEVLGDKLAKEIAVSSARAQQYWDSAVVLMTACHCFLMEELRMTFGEHQ